MRVCCENPRARPWWTADVDFGSSSTKALGLQSSAAVAAELADWLGAAALLAEDAKLTQHECAPYTRVLLSYDVHSTNIIVRLLYFSSGTRSQNEAFVPGPHGMLPLEIC